MRSVSTWGWTSLIVTSDGEVIANPRFLRKASKRLRRAQRVLSRRQKGSANRAKARHRVAVVHRKVRETRLDHAHKTALRLVRDNQAVYAEDLAVTGLLRTRLARSVADAGWSQLLRCIEEKAARYGRTFARIGRFEPTSQVCSACGVKDGPKPLSVRAWTCAACGTVHDRDVNAARNILAAGRADRLNACGGERKTRACPGGCRRSRNPPERGVSRAGGIPVLQGGEDVKRIDAMLKACRASRRWMPSKGPWPDSRSRTPAW